ncbi:MAG TPA: hypothetical protein VJR03_07740 [Nitrospira sp.]|nr:hypothetical protein [Nitrospira sp.]
MTTSEDTGSHADRLVQWMPLAIAIVLIFSMMPTREEWLYVAAVLGGLASLAVGRSLGRADELVLRGRLWRFAKGWLLVVVLASFSLLHGKWEPMVFFAVVGLLSSAFFWVGCKSSK